MTISTLIAELQKLQALHGDLPVTCSSLEARPDGGMGDDVQIREVAVSFEEYDHLGSEVGYENAHIHLS